MSFRCPNVKCRQAEVMHINIGDPGSLIAIVHNHTLTEAVMYYHDEIIVKDDPRFEELWKKIDEVTADKPSMCPNCEKIHTFEQWRDAFENPMEHFDADQLCHCGGELWWDNIPGTTSYAHVCDRCNWVKPKAVISGA